MLPCGFNSRKIDLVNPTPLSNVKIRSDSCAQNTTTDTEAQSSKKEVIKENTHHGATA